MKKIFAPAILWFSLVAGASAANWYVRPAAQGANSGVDWSNAWSMASLNSNWSRVNAGDTVWLAGGTYTTGMVMGKSGAAGNPIRVMRPLASDAAPTAAAGWTSSFDAQVVISPTSDIPIKWTSANGVGSYITFDGRVDSGIRCKLDNSGAGDPYPGAVTFVRSSAGNQTDVSFNYMDLAGPAPDATPYNYGTQYKCGVSLDAGWNANQKLSNISFSHCRIHGGADLVIIVNGVNILFEYCKFYDNVVQSGGSAPHDNMFEVNECNGFILRYSELYHWAVEGFRPYGNVTNVEIYGNLWRDTVNSVARCIEPDSSVGSSWGPLKLYNNTFANIQLSVMSGGGMPFTYAAGSLAQNNLALNASFSFGNGLTNNNNATVTSGQFVGAASGNYHLAGATAKGATISAPYNLDADGLPRGADGSWDLGAYEFGGAPPADPTKHCIRAGAPAGGDGTTWDKAWTSLPTSLVRGHTYYLAGGNYGTYDFQSVTGTSYITVKKATENDHGSSTGWQAAYGTDPAIFSGSAGTTWGMGLSYLEVDGVTGSGTTGYGIQVTNSRAVENDGVLKIYNGQPSSHVRLKHVEIAANPWPNSAGQRVFFDESYGGSGDYLFQNVYVHGGRCWLSLNGTHNVIVENSYFKDAGTNADAFHAAGIVLTGSNVTIRYNVFENMLGPSLPVTTYIEPQGINSVNGLYIYGNVFKATSSNEYTTQGILALTSADIATNVRIYNNTMVGLHGDAPGIWGGNVAGSTVFVSNNIWQGCQNPPNFTSVTSETNNLKNTGGASFVNAAAGDFHLTAALPGAVPPAPYNAAPYSLDPLQITRGADGVWDIGAYEYTSGTPPPFTYHPADADNNKHITAAEATFYGACWKKAPDTSGGCPSNPAATMDNAVRAGSLWSSSVDGTYHYDLSSGACPLCWQPN